MVSYEVLNAGAVPSDVSPQRAAGYRRFSGSRNFKLDRTEATWWALTCGALFPQEFRTKVATSATC
jgi:hypothetical protein